MTVYVEKKAHYNYKYLLYWPDPDTGVLLHDWFHDMKELREYIDGWLAKIVYL